VTADAANARISILRGTTENVLGDTVDDDQVAFEHIPAIVVETGRTIDDPSTPTPRVIREIVAHVPWWTQLTSKDRIYDEGTHDTYIVIGVTRPPTLIGAPVDLMAQLKRVTASRP
jgi:hypothetical protein